MKREAMGSLFVIKLLVFYDLFFDRGEDIKATNRGPFCFYFARFKSQPAAPCDWSWCSLWQWWGSLGGATAVID